MNVGQENCSIDRAGRCKVKSTFPSEPMMKA